MRKLRFTKREALTIGGFLGYCVLFLILFLTNPLIRPQGFTLLCLFPLMLLAWKALFYPCHPGWLKRYDRPGRKAAIGLTSVYASLASFGHRLLAMDEARMHIEADDILYLLLGALWLLPILLLVLYTLQILGERKVSPSRVHWARWKVCWLIFLVLSAVQGMAVYSFFPGGYGNDGAYELMQAWGKLPLDDWHPFINAMAERLLLRLCAHPGFITLIQAEAFALLVTAYLMVARDCGVRLRILLPVGVGFMLLPPQVMNSISVTKDMPYLYGLLWTMLLLFKGIRRTNLVQKPRFWLGMAAGLFLILTYRHNGIVPAAFLMVTCLGLMFHQIRHGGKRPWMWLLGPIIACLSFGLWKGPVFEKLEVKENTSSTYVTMLCGTAACIHNDLPLSPEATAIMEEVIPLEAWRLGYSRFEGHDTYMWGLSVPFNTTGVTAGKAFRVYLEALIRYPDVVLKDRLDGMDILWNIRQPDKSFNVRYFDYLDPSFGLEEMVDLSSLAKEGNVYRSHRGLSDLYRTWSEWRTFGGINDMLLWRGGAYVILLLLLLIFWQANGLSWMTVVSVPCLGNLFCSLLAVYHQSFRYVYFIQIMPLGLALLTISVMKRRHVQAPMEV